MPRIHVALTIDGGPAVPTYANRSNEALNKLLRNYKGRRFRVRTVDVPNDTATLCALIENPLKVLGSLTSLSEITVYINESGQVRVDKTSPTPPQPVPPAPPSTMN